MKPLVNKVISKTIVVKPIEKSKRTKVNNKVKPVVKSLEKDIMSKTIKAVIKLSPLANTFKSKLELLLSLNELEITPTIFILNLKLSITAE
jgi:hypothetical protein